MCSHMLIQACAHYNMHLSLGSLVYLAYIGVTVLACDIIMYYIVNTVRLFNILKIFGI